MDSKTNKREIIPAGNIIPREVAVVYGGVSGEKDICNLEGTLMIKFLRKHGHKVYPIKIDETNSFLRKLKKSPKFAILCLTEDLGIQWILDLYGIKYNGSGPFSTFLSLDKALLKTMIQSWGMTTPSFFEIKQGDEFNNKLNYPLVIKPARSGSSHGISLVKSEKELPQALKKAFKDDSNIILEEFIKGTEVTIVCISERILGVVEINKGKEPIYSYETKLYGQVKCYEPARISKLAFEEIDNMIGKIVSRLGVRNLFRVDAIVKNNDVFFLEINTLPFMAEGGEPFEAVKNKGWDMYKFIEEVVKDALKNTSERVLG